MALEILKALFAGILAALPIGPVFLLVFRNTTCNGKKAGFLCALGCVILDTSLAALSIFALGFIEGFIKDNENLLMIIGSAILIGMGLSILFSKVSEDQLSLREKSNFLNCTAKTFLTGLSNPAAFAVMLAIMASLGLGASDLTAPVWSVILAVAVGELIYWFIIVFVILQRFRFSVKLKRIINYVTGTGIIVFGLIMIGKIIFG